LGAIAINEIKERSAIIVFILIGKFRLNINICWAANVRT
jgi:hypothetical protein